MLSFVFKQLPRQALPAQLIQSSQGLVFGNLTKILFYA